MNSVSDYPTWYAATAPTAAALERMRRESEGLAVRPLISVVMPVFDPEEMWLRRAIESVAGQAYPYWELVAVDDGSLNPGIPGILADYAAAESRIRTAGSPVNTGISKATNTALELARGEFVALLDHDDVLEPDALFAVARSLNDRPDADLVYTDEHKVLGSDTSPVEAFLKPGWSPDLLRSLNYLGHLCVLRRDLVMRLGGFRPEFDGSQDYDLLLRLTEVSDRVLHVPRPLYRWRRVEGSLADSEEAKDYALKAAVRAIREAAARGGEDVTVEVALPGRYRVRYQPPCEPLIAVVVWGEAEAVSESAARVEASDYPHLEVVPAPDTQGMTRAAIWNSAIESCRGEIIVLLRAGLRLNDPKWLRALLEQGHRKEVGVVGGRVVTDGGRIANAGLVLLSDRVEPAYRGQPDNLSVYFGVAGSVRNCTAVTAGCLMVRREVLDNFGTFDPELDYPVAETDLCLRLEEAGLRVVCTPYAGVAGEEQAGGYPLSRRFVRRWKSRLAEGDAHYAPYLDTDFSELRFRVDP